MRASRARGGRFQRTTRADLRHESQQGARGDGADRAGVKHARATSRINTAPCGAEQGCACIGNLEIGA